MSPRYTVSAPAFIGDRLVIPGDMVHFDGPPGPHMEPAIINGREDPEARAAKDAAMQSQLPTPDHPSYIHALVNNPLINGNLAGGPKAGASDPMQGQMTVPGLAVDAQGQVRGVQEGVGTGDPGDGSQADTEGKGPGISNVENPSPVRDPADDNGKPKAKR